MRALTALLTGIVDYAGLYPPASLELASAVRAYASYRAGPAAWMLGRFVVPASRLDDFQHVAEAIVPAATPPGPWQLIATGTPDTGDDILRIRAFNRRQDERGVRWFLVDSYENRVAHSREVSALASRAGGDLRVAFELPLGSGSAIAPLIAAIGHAGGIAKIRTGGLTPDTIPDVETVAAVIWEAASARVPVKATAGLHHPVRSRQPLTYGADSPVATVHGFLNVFVAATLAEGLIATMPEADGRQRLARILSEEDAAAFVFDDEGLGWRGHHVDLGVVCQVRTSVALSFGSCSFDEPVEELRTLRLGY